MATLGRLMSLLSPFDGIETEGRGTATSTYAATDRI
ncbi:hypothetical protein ACSYGQ_02275 [Escherichia coli]